MEKNQLKDLNQTPLYGHFIALALFPQLAVHVRQQLAYTGLPSGSPEKDIGQRIAICQCLNIFLVNRAFFRGNDGAGKDDVWHGVDHTA